MGLEVFNEEKYIKSKAILDDEDDESDEYDIIGLSINQAVNKINDLFPFTINRFISSRISRNMYMFQFGYPIETMHVICAYNIVVKVFKISMISMIS